jgi:general secretion pathway protein B
MSYILEALKKSQEERELGQVPTLVAAPISDPRRPTRGNPWVLVAVGLAALALAVAIALHTALNRVGVPPAAATSEPLVAAAPRNPPVPAPIPEAPQPRPGSRVAAGPVVQAASAGGQASHEATRRDELTPRGAGAGSDEGAENGEGAVNAGDPMDEPISGDWMEMDEEIGPARPAEPPPAPRERPRRTRPARPAIPEPAIQPIPDDLRQDVAAFKDDLLRERSGAPPRPAAAKPTAEDPTKLRLPLEVEGRLPAFFVTAHIYDPVPDKRFVVINSLKYTQGETTREKLKVEEILPDGVVLGFEGNRFYRRR